MSINRFLTLFVCLNQSQVIIVGTSFIGMEVAAYLVDKAGSVTVIGRGSTPFSHAFGILSYYKKKPHQELKI